MSLFKKVPLEVYPLLAAVSVGGALAGYTMYFHLSTNPDINLAKVSNSRVGSNEWKVTYNDNYSPRMPFMAGEKSNRKIQTKHQ